MVYKNGKCKERIALELNLLRSLRFFSPLRETYTKKDSILLYNYNKDGIFSLSTIIQGLTTSFKRNLRNQPVCFSSLPIRRSRD
jgi:hypothetical protein